MEQPWIHKAKTDSFFILAPSFIVLGIIFLFQDWLEQIESQYSFYTWLFLIVFIDVAHVYATLFKTYFVPAEFRARKQLLLRLPLVCFVAGIVLFAFGSALFWSVLAYVAVFHFIRQQYGFMRLYARMEKKTKGTVLFDNLVIYTATGYPMIYWFLSGTRKYNWFMPNEFFTFENQLWVQIATTIYCCIMIFYVLRTIYTGIKEGYFNLPKNVIIVGTALSWYFGIVYYNDDFIFTLLNVVSHGIPYMALIYLKEIDNKPETELGTLRFLKAYKGVFVFIAILITIAFTEEYLWEILVWNQQFTVTSFDFSRWQILVVPLLTVPQFTHYILDGFIWKNK